MVNFTVNDTTAPMINCGAVSAQMGTADSNCQATVPDVRALVRAQSKDNCTMQASLTVTQSPMQGSMVSGIGSHPITVTVTDASNNSTPCVVAFSVVDNTPPTITCPAPVTHGTDPNVCMAMVTYAAPMVSDNVSAFTATNACNAVVNYTQPTANDVCDGARTVTCNPASGSTFSKGVTTVNCSATDLSNNTGNCSFTVTVTDNVPPAFTGCTNVTASTASNSCDAVVNYTTPTANDNCDGARTVTCNPAPGSTFNKGVTTVTCTASDANTPTANTGTCMFTVTVNDTVAPTLDACPAPITQGTDHDACLAVVTYTNPAGHDNCPGVTVACTPASGSTFQKGVTTVGCKATDTSSNTSAPCTFTVTVKDTQNPTVTCPNNINFTTPGNNDPCGTVNYATPSGSDNCPLGPNPVTCSPQSGTCFPVGMTTVTCTVTDTSSNTGQCTFKITVSNPCTITCPGDQTASTGPGATTCGTVVSYPAPTTTGGGCGTVACSPPSGSFFPVGMTTVTCTTAGPSCTFKVTVVDNTPPVLNCPNVMQNNDPGQCGAQVNYAKPAATDNCTPSNQIVVMCQPASGTFFPAGTTTVNRMEGCFQQHGDVQLHGDGEGHAAAGLYERVPGGNHDDRATIVPVRDEHGGELHHAHGYR